MAQFNISRRTMLLGGGATGVALTGALLTGRLSGAARDRDLPEPPSSPVVGVFDTSADQQLLAPTPLMNTTVVQSFAFDDTRGDLYAVQIVQGGLWLDDEPDRLTSAERSLNGDLCVTRVPVSGNGKTEYMYLRGFGHGVSIGIEPSRSGVWLWTESDADPKTGYGRAVARVPFKAGSTLDSDDPSVRHHRPVPGSVANQPVLDLVGDRVMVSYWTTDKPAQQWYSVYRRDEFLAGRYQELHAVRQVGRKTSETFQGCTLFGDHVYQLAGTAYTGADGRNPPSSKGNARLSAIDLRTGEPSGRARVYAASGLPHREPEGLAVQVTDQPRLCAGFAVGDSGDRTLTVHAFIQA
ncbi:signaling protein [Streptomyces sp. NPDC060048]|uniref:phage baseplate protein n=1 Tax=unclassified Streptomyces TaxID=2593676 RepID=UPI0036865A57